MMVLMVIEMMVLSLLRATLPAAEMIHRHLSHLRKIRLLRFNQQSGAECLVVEFSVDLHPLESHLKVLTYTCVSQSHI